MTTRGLLCHCVDCLFRLNRYGIVGLCVSYGSSFEHVRDLNETKVLSCDIFTS